MDYDLNIVNVCTFLRDYLRNGHTNVDIFESMLESLAFDYSSKPERRVRSRIANGNQKNPERSEIEDIVKALPSLHDIKEMRKEVLSGVLKRWDKSEEELAEALLGFLLPAKSAHAKNTLSEWKADKDFSSFILGVFLHSIKLSGLRASNRSGWEVQSKKASSKCMEEANAARKVRRGLNANCTKDPNGSKSRTTQEKTEHESIQSSRSNANGSESRIQTATKVNSTSSPDNSKILDSTLHSSQRLSRGDGSYVMMKMYCCSDAQGAKGRLTPREFLCNNLQVETKQVEIVALAETTAEEFLEIIETTLRIVQITQLDIYFSTAPLYLQCLQLARM